MLLCTVVHWVSFRHMSSYESMTKQAILRNIFFSRRSIWVLLELICRWTQHLTKIDQENCKIEQINLNLEPKDYRIYYVNIDFHHQYDIIMSHCMHHVFLQRYIVHHRPWLSFRHISRYESIGKQAIFVEHILHQYGISVAESQRFLLAKRSERWGARINGCFSQANSLPTNFIYPATWNLSQSPATGKWLPTQCKENISRTKSFSKIL